jgi:hypothetical protein
MELLTITQSKVSELATKLAEEKLMDNLFRGLIHDPKDEPVWVKDKNGVDVYSDKMQEEFDTLYDHYLTIVEQTLDIYTQ